MIKINDDNQTGSQASKIAALETSTSNLASSFTQLNNGLGGRVTSLETSFPAGCNTIMQAVTAKGVTPASNSPSDIASAISNISTGMDYDYMVMYSFISDMLYGNNNIEYYVMTGKEILFYSSYANTNNTDLIVYKFANNIKTNEELFKITYFSTANNRGNYLEVRRNMNIHIYSSVNFGSSGYNDSLDFIDYGSVNASSGDYIGLNKSERSVVALSSFKSSSYPIEASSISISGRFVAIVKLL